MSIVNTNLYQGSNFVTNDQNMCFTDKSCLIPLLFYALFPALVTHTDIRIVSAEEYLLTLGDDFAVDESGVDDGFCTAGTHRLYLGYRVGYLKQTSAAGEPYGCGNPF